MPSTTNNLSLYLPDAGESNVADELNNNFTTLDGRFDESSGHTHDGTAGEGPKIPVTSISASGTADNTTFLRGDGAWASGGGGSGVTDHGDLTGLADDDHTQYYNQARGDARYARKSNNLSDLTDAAAARTNLGVAASSHTHGASAITSGTIDTARLGSGTADNTKYLRGDQTWATISVSDGNQSANTVKAGPTSGGAAAAAYRLLVAADIPTITVAKLSDWLESLQDAVAAMLSGGTHSGISFAYDDTDGTIDATVSGGGGGSVATDAIWDAAGDLAVGSGANTAAKLSMGTALQVLRVNSGATGLEWAAAGGGSGNVSSTGADSGGRPGSPASGDLFFPNDGIYVRRYNGTSWESWGPIYPLTEPVDGDFSWVNQGTATVETTRGGIYLHAPAVSAALRARVKTAPATPYTITCRLLFNLLTGRAGLCFRQSSDGKLATFTYDFSSGGASNWYSTKYTSPGVVSANYSGALTASGMNIGREFYMRIADDGTNRIISASWDGVHFFVVHTIGRTDFLTADQVGFFVDANQTTHPAGMLVESWLQA